MKKLILSVVVMFSLANLGFGGSLHPISGFSHNVSYAAPVMILAE
ncbi:MULTISPECIES: hypothetical protein [Francisella]|uniref:Uncharacterized protein n=1 Tax=Francisella salina TaxID=573569 RepID=A0ABN3ZS07_FRAST|nr:MULTISPECIES: hypothetical protein [Francisella]AEI36270.1 hypothetical protein F7308_1344 [Francisella salina]